MNSEGPVTETTPPAAVPPPAASPASPADTVRASLAGNLHRLRLARGLSLRELSAGTGVSKALLSQIERSEANPTVDVLVRIATALETTCDELLRRPLLRPEIVRAAQLPEPPDETSVNLLFADPEPRRTEMYRTRLHPHAQSQLSSHGAGSVEYVVVLSGAVALVVEGEEHHLATGDGARFSGMSSHYYATYDAPAVTLTTVGYRS
ncbi:helix-turn-helix transcriptional regulator [Streptomyces misionensis]|uniref:Helix-turn-helix transcriptional regulator n=1 Tax=Streptomyces misionensis TaxID=67331 RepID=A0A5C6JRD2_9ACTN|nr:XRE family transcriptional regulator [Streptomyces misionensis]TWV43427.1 helix-turn-helix transcriptional regulator [Streptomyces misionensis]